PRGQLRQVVRIDRVRHRGLAIGHVGPRLLEHLARLPPPLHADDRVVLAVPDGDRVVLQPVEVEREIGHVRDESAQANGARGARPSTPPGGSRSCSFVPRPCSITRAPAGSAAGGLMTWARASAGIRPDPDILRAMSEADPARNAAAATALERIEPGMTIGLGSGRAVWRLIELIGERWPEGAPLR